MEDLFSMSAKTIAPLADRMRPRNLDEFVGQEQIIGKDKLLRLSLIHVFGQDDEAVNPAVAARVAELLNAETFDGAGAGHGYGFYSEDPALRLKVADAVANFFAANLK